MNITDHLEPVNASEQKKLTKKMTAKEKSTCLLPVNLETGYPREATAIFADDLSSQGHDSWTTSHPNVTPSGPLPEEIDL